MCRKLFYLFSSSTARRWNSSPGKWFDHGGESPSLAMRRPRSYGVSCDAGLLKRRINTSPFPTIRCLQLLCRASVFIIGQQNCITSSLCLNSFGVFILRRCKFRALMKFHRAEFMGRSLFKKETLREGCWIARKITLFAGGRVSSFKGLTLYFCYTVMRGHSWYSGLSWGSYYAGGHYFDWNDEGRCDLGGTWLMNPVA